MKTSAPPPCVVPIRTFKRLASRFPFSSRPVLTSIHGSDLLALRQLRDDLTKRDRGARVRRAAARGEVTVRRDRGVVHAEGYRLRVDTSGIAITAATDAGAFYGIQTLRELIAIYGLRLPCCEIEDAPAFARRGIYHDCSRGKVPKVSTVKALIGFLARFKINELQLYLENTFTFQKHPEIGKGFSPYTPQDLLEIQAHAAKHHVNFVPSLTSFGHFEKILMLPEYSSLGEYPGFRNYPGGTTLCPTDPRSIRLLADMYEDFLPNFTSEDFNVCGDEPWELGKGRSKRRAERLGLGRVYLDFILKVHKLCLKHGRRMNLWSDIVLDHPEMIPEIPRDIVMLNWDYGTTGKRIDRSHEIVEAGLPWVACPGTHGWLSHGSRINDSLENTSFFARSAQENGAEGFMTTDWGDCGHRQFLGPCLAGMAHGAAHAWHTNGVVDKTHLRRFTRVVFNDTSGQLARNLAVLGAKESGYWAYSALVESLAESKTLATGFAASRCHIDQVGLTGKSLNGHMERLLALPWASPSESMETFLRQALDEFPVATEMERLAYKRILLARTVRGERQPEPRELKKHARELEACAEKFAHMWLRRNRPSRLRDNLNAFRIAAREARSLATR